MSLIRAYCGLCNELIEKSAPWKLAKEPERADASPPFSTISPEALSHHCNPPFAGAAERRPRASLRNSIGIDLSHSADAKWGGLPDGHLLGKTDAALPENRNRGWGRLASSIVEFDGRLSPAVRALFIESVSGFTPTFRQRLEFLGLSSFVWLVGRLPYRWLRRIANVLGSIVFFSTTEGRRSLLANLDAAFGDSRTPAEKRRIAMGSYRTFARTMLELFWSPNLSESVARGIAQYEGLALDSCHKDPRQAAVYLCLHYSNFEWLSQFGAYTIANGPVIAQRFKNPLIGRIFDRLRSSMGHDVIPQERAMIRMLKHMKSGGNLRCFATSISIRVSRA